MFARHGRESYPKGSIAIAFNNDPAILGAVTAIVFMQIVVAAPIGSWMGKDVEDPEAEDQEASESTAETAEGISNG